LTLREHAARCVSARSAPRRHARAFIYPIIFIRFISAFDGHYCASKILRAAMMPCHYADYFFSRYFSPPIIFITPFAMIISLITFADDYFRHFHAYCHTRRCFRLLHFR
jgi:hypothetical protein